MPKGEAMQSSVGARPVALFLDIGGVLGTDGWEADMPREFAALERLSAGSVHEEVDAAAT